MAIRLQVLMQRGRRDEQSIAAARAALAGLGMRPTVSGAATISAEIEPADFERLFGPPTERDSALRIPDALRDVVASITIAPQYLRMNESEQPEP